MIKAPPYTQPTDRVRSETTVERTPSLALAKRIQNEQGKAQAEFFLHSMRRFLPEGEIKMLEETLGLRATAPPEKKPENRQPEKASAPQMMPGINPMMQLLMQSMNGSGRPTPNMLMQMLGRK